MDKDFLDIFVKNFELYIKSNRNYITEDIVRFIFYNSLIKENICSKNDIEIEKQYKTIVKKYMLVNGKNKPRIDMFIRNRKDCIEFKFHNSKTKEASTTEQLGEIVSDLSRLSSIDRKNHKKYLIYFANNIMNDYINRFNNPNEIYIRDLYLHKNKEIKLYNCIKAKKSKTFVNKVESSFNKNEYNIFVKNSNNIYIKSIYKKKVNKFYIRVFEIIDI